MDAGCQANCLTLLSSLASSFTSSHQKQSLNGVHKLVLFHTDLLSSTSFWVASTGEVDDTKPQNINLFNFGVGAPNHILTSPIIDTNASDFPEERKQPTPASHMVIDQKIFVCEYSQCPYGDTRLGFLNQNSRNNHQLNCPYWYGSSTLGFGVTNFQGNNSAPANFANFNVNFNVNGLGLPKNRQNIFSRLMTVKHEVVLSEEIAFRSL
ncbi:unnamed protein product [Amaranthus hypochondriacus]